MHEPRPQGDVEPVASGNPALLAVGVSGCVALLAVMCAGVFGVGAVLALRDPAPAAVPEPIVAAVLPAAAEPAAAETDHEATDHEATDDEATDDEATDDGASGEVARAPSAPAWRPPPAREAPEPEPEEAWDLVEPTFEPSPKPQARHPKAGMGAVQFEISAGDAVHVYASGELVAAMSPNRRAVFVDLAPGTHRVLFKDVVNGKVLHKGVLTITEGRVVRVAFGKLQAPEQVYGPADAWRGK